MKFRIILNFHFELLGSNRLLESSIWWSKTYVIMI